MVVEDIELRGGPSLALFQVHPMQCEHFWEPHLWEINRACCSCCGSNARWVNDPRAGEGAPV